MSRMNPVEHDEQRRRFTLEYDGARGVLDYSLSGEVMTITHTEVPTRIARRGIAAELMKSALGAAHARGWRVTPACSYAAAYVARHPEALDDSFPASDSPAVGRVD